MTLVSGNRTIFFLSFRYDARLIGILCFIAIVCSGDNNMFRSDYLTCAQCFRGSHVMNSTSSQSRPSGWNLQHVLSMWMGRPSKLRFGTQASPAFCNIGDSVGRMNVVC